MAIPTEGDATPPAWRTPTGTVTVGTPVLWWPRPHIAHSGVVIAADPDTGHPVVAVAGHYGAATRTVPPATLHRAPGGDHA